jgi:hypothetical protein
LDTAFGSHENYLRFEVDFLAVRFAGDFEDRPGASSAGRVRLLSTLMGADLLTVPSSLRALLTIFCIWLSLANAPSSLSLDWAIAASAAESA